MVKATTNESGVVEAAIAEATNADELKVEFNAHTYAVSRAAIASVQYVLLMQQNKDVLAAQYLLGGEQFAEFLSANADDQGRTPRKVIWDFFDAAGKEMGTGNR